MSSKNFKYPEKIDGENENEQLNYKDESQEDLIDQFISNFESQL